MRSRRCSPGSWESIGGGSSSPTRGHGPIGPSIAWPWTSTAFDTRLRALVTALGQRPQRSSADVADRVAVWAEVDRLPLRQRQVIYLRYRSDLEHAEIGQVLGITASAARSHATQAIATLRGRLVAGPQEEPHGH